MNKTETIVFDGFRKRDGMVVPFRRDKIVLAISRAADESDPLDGLVYTGSIDIRPHDLVARVQFHRHVGTIIDEPGDKAIVEALFR